LQLTAPIEILTQAYTILLLQVFKLQNLPRNHQFFIYIKIDLRGASVEGRII
jgi:hypothetical protein